MADYYAHRAAGFPGVIKRPSHLVGANGGVAAESDYSSSSSSPVRAAFAAAMIFSACSGGTKS